MTAEASKVTAVGFTSGYGRTAGRFVHHRDQEAYPARNLDRHAVRLLTSDLDHPMLTPRRTLNALDLTHAHRVS